MRKLVLPSLSVLIAACGTAFAQAPPVTAAPVAPPAPATTETPGCTPTQAAPSQGTITAPTNGGRREPLADRLARTDGVLCPPPGIDPSIRAPTPQTGNTPVIPPPGSPGGDPTVRPK